MSLDKSGLVHISGGQIRAGAMAPVLMLDPHRPARSWRFDGVTALADLQLGLLIGREDEIALTEGLVVPLPVIEIEHPPRLTLEIGGPREDPAAGTQGRIAS